MHPTNCHPYQTVICKIKQFFIIGKTRYRLQAFALLRLTANAVDGNELAVKDVAVAVEELRAGRKHDVAALCIELDEPENVSATHFRDS